MATLFIYLIKVNVALILFCMGYYFVLRHLTFYTLNRVYLVCGILFSTLYPFINFSGFINRHAQIARPVQMVVVNWEAPVNYAVHNTVITHQTYFNWPLLILWAGIIAFALRFIFQLISLYRLHRKSKPMLLNQHHVRAVNKNINPFSFLKSIYINPKNHNAAELEVILEHEQVHVNEWHTADILLSELSIIFYWFNPGVWLLKRAIHENIEFITDRRILQNGLDAKAYQYSLLNVNFNNKHSMLANHFNASAIKKRIVMMNAERSSLFNMGRYLFLIPVLALLLVIFSSSKNDLRRQILKDKTDFINSFKNLGAEVESSLPSTILPKTNRSKIYLQAVNAGELTEQTNNKQPEILSAKKIAIKDDSLNKILPLGAYPDSIYLNGIWGETKSLLRYLKEDDIAAMTQGFISNDRNNRDPNNQLIEAYTKDVKDYRPILEMDEKISKLIHWPRIRVIRINGVLSTKEELQKIPVEKIQQIQFSWRDADNKPGSYMWVTTKQ